MEREISMKWLKTNFDNCHSTWILPLAADLRLIVFVRLCQAIGVAVASDCAVVLHLSDARQCPWQH